MTSPADSSTRWNAPGLPLLLVILSVLTVVRIIGLHLSVVDLFFDEAQYWVWSRDLAFGYFSKPPLLAWIIAASDRVCGSGEACVRLASPLFYCGTSLVVYAIAKELYGKQTAFWSALAVGLLTGVSFSSRIISTDVPLLFCWALAVLAYLKLMAAPNWRWALVLGVALGLGFLAKYAMIFFAFGVAGTALLDREARDVLWRSQTWIAFAIAFLIFSPNIYWNIAHKFATVRHTGDNISGSAGFRFRPLEAAEFVGSQFAVVGPLIFGAFLMICFFAVRGKATRQDKLMLSFALAPLLLVVGLSFIRGANANWAAPGVLTMTIVVVAWWLRTDRRTWIMASLAIGVFTQALLVVTDAFADRITIPALGRNADVYERTLGWRALAENAARLAREASAPTVAAEGRSELAALTYYLRDEPRKVVSWPLTAEARNQFDITQALDDTAKEPVLLISACPSIPRLQRFYARVTAQPRLTIQPGPHSTRRYAVFTLAGRQQPIAPLGPCTK